MNQRLALELLLVFGACEPASPAGPASRSRTLAIVAEEEPAPVVYPSEPARGPDWGEDLDGDGLAGQDDCDEQNGEVHGGSRETECDRRDQDCDGEDLCTPDADEDGARASVDCDDETPETRPGAEEAPCDGIDQDCDGKDPC